MKNVVLMLVVFVLPPQQIMSFITSIFLLSNTTLGICYFLTQQISTLLSFSESSHCSRRISWMNNLNQEFTSFSWLQNQDGFCQRTDGENINCALPVYHFMREKCFVLNFILCEFHLELGSFLLQWKGDELGSKSLV